MTPQPALVSTGAQSTDLMPLAYSKLEGAVKRASAKALSITSVSWKVPTCRMISAVFRSAATSLRASVARHRCAHGITLGRSWLQHMQAESAPVFSRRMRMTSSASFSKSTWLAMVLLSCSTA